MFGWDIVWPQYRLFLNSPTKSFNYFLVVLQMNPRSYPQSYIVFSPHSTYNAVVKLSKTGKEEIVLGGEKICVTISAPTNELNVRDGAKCYINANFPERLQDAKDLVKAAIFVLKQRSPVCNIELTDFSDKEGTPLSSAMIVFNQKTWYEREFKSHLKDPTLQITYKKQMLLFQDVHSKLPSEDFKTFLHNNKAIDVDTIMQIYSASETYKAFFQNLKRTIPAALLYDVIRPWLTPFVNKVLVLRFVREDPWVISCEDLDLSGYRLEELDADPWKGNYKGAWIGQTGGSYKRKLSEADKKSFQYAYWIGWDDLDLNDYSPSDREYLQSLRNELQ